MKKLALLLIVCMSASAQSTRQPAEIEAEFNQLIKDTEAARAAFHVVVKRLLAVRDEAEAAGFVIKTSGCLQVYGTNRNTWLLMEASEEPCVGELIR